MVLLDGKAVSQKISSLLKSQVGSLSIKPKLDIIQVGDNPASTKYVGLKQQKAVEIGIEVEVHKFPQSSSTEEIIGLVNKLNSDPKTTGFFIQLPLPAQINTLEVLNSINPCKDVDGLTAANLGLLFQRSQKAVAPATPLGIIKLLEEYKIDLVGKNAVIIGRGLTVGLPLLALLQAKNVTVTLCHSYTKNLKDICLQADIIISAVGKKNLVTKDFVKPNAIVIDVGGGDVDFENVSRKCSFITPTFGGVGPMTITCLLLNLISLLNSFVSSSSLSFP